MAQSPINFNNDLPIFSILLEGRAIDSSYAVRSIRTVNAVNQIPYARIVLVDGDVTGEEFLISNKTDFIPGAQVEIKAGYDNKEETIFKGIISKHRVSSNALGSELRLECSDPAIKMTFGRKNKCFKDQTDSDIIASLIKESGLIAEVENTSAKHPSMVQYYASDWDFILTRAKANGQMVVVNGGRVSVGRPDISKTPELVVEQGLSIYEFNAEIDATHQFNKAKAYAWDETTQKVIEGTGRADVQRAGNVSATMLADAIEFPELELQSNGSLKVEELNSWAAGQDMRAKLSGTTGYVQFAGSALAATGEMIELKGVGDRFNGNVFISSVTHTLDNGQWKTEVEFGMPLEIWGDPPEHFSAQPASGLLPGVSGLQTGTVVQVHDDPEKNFRVLVKIPLLRQENQYIWARMGANYASNGSGHFLYPEVHDEVILGFLNDDPRYPVILGSLFSSANKPPENPEEKNNKKTFRTRSKLELAFDDEDQTIAIKTPAGNQFTISDKDKGLKLEDQNQNSIVMNDSGMVLNSTSDIILKARENITIEAGANLTQKALASVSVEGLHIENTAQIGFSAKGNATAELSASGETNVKGAIVNIN